MEEEVLHELEKYQLQLTTLWQESEVSTTATRPTRAKAPLSFTASPSNLSESYVPLEPAVEKQLLPMEEVQGGQECQHPFSVSHSYKPSNVKLKFLYFY